MHIALNSLRNIQQYSNAECFNPLKSLKTICNDFTNCQVGPMHDGPHHSVAKAIKAIKAVAKAAT